MSQALALDPNYARAHSLRAGVLRVQGHLDEAIAENERALALDPSLVNADSGLGLDYMHLGQFEKSLEYLRQGDSAEPARSILWLFCIATKAADYFGLKQYDQAIEWARRAIAINPNSSASPHLNLIAALALTGHEAEAHEALQNYLASVPDWTQDDRGVEGVRISSFTNPHSDPRYLETVGPAIRGPAQGGVPEQ